MTNISQTLNMPFAWRKLALISVSVAALGSMTACAPLQSYDLADYETHTQAVSYTPQSIQKMPAHKRYGFNAHNLDSQISDNYEISRETEFRQIQKFAAAKPPRLSPYVPAQDVPNFGTQNFDPQKLDAPQLRPRFEHHLDGTLGSSFENFEPQLNVTPLPQAQSLPPIQALPKTLPKAKPVDALPNLPKTTPQPAPQITSTTEAFTLPASKPSSTSVINPFELNNALDVSPLGANRFETRQANADELSIPELPEPQKQVIRDEQAALIGIEDKSILAGSTSLRSSLDSAFARSSRLAAESLRVDEAEEVLKQAKARSRPRIEFRSAVGPRQSETTFAFDNSTVSAATIRRSAELDLSLPIYQGGRLRAQRSSAELGIESARAAVSQTRGQIIEETAIAYLDVVRDRQLTELYHKNVDLLREQQSSVTELLAVNESTISEKALIDAQLATQRIRLETGLGVLRESEARYRNLVGQAAPQNLPVPSFDLPVSLIEIQALAQQNNPELTALINQAKSAEFDVDVAKSDNRPSLALQGVLRGAEGQSETIDRNAAAELLLNLRVPISSGGEGRSRVRQAKIIRNRLNLEIRDTQDNLRDQIDSLWARKTASEKSQLFNKNQIEATQFAVDTVAEQRAEGVATVLDLLNVQQTLLDAQIQTIEARNRQDTASVQLLNLMGVYL